MLTWPLNILTSSSKSWETIIFWMIWSILLTKHSMLHDLFTTGINGNMSRGWMRVMPTVSHPHSKESLEKGICICSTISKLTWSMSMTFFYLYKSSFFRHVHLQTHILQHERQSRSCQTSLHQKWRRIRRHQGGILLRRMAKFQSKDK